MATSGTTAFDLSIEEIIQEAYERCGMTTTSGHSLRSARTSLNLLFAEWANRGIHLWKVALHENALVSGQAEYAVDSAVSDVLEAFVSTTAAGANTVNTQDVSLTKIDTYTVLKYYVIKRIQDAGAYTNDADIVFRFLPCMVAGLAYYLAMKNAPTLVQQNKLIYEDQLKRALDEDGQRASTYITPQSFYPNGI